MLGKCCGERVLPEEPFFCPDFLTAYAESPKNRPTFVLDENLLFKDLRSRVVGNHGGWDRLSKALKEMRAKQRQECSAIQAMQASPVARVERGQAVQKIGQDSELGDSEQSRSPAGRRTRPQSDWDGAAKKADHISIQSAVDLYLKDMDQRGISRSARAAPRPGTRISHDAAVKLIQNAL